MDDDAELEAAFARAKRAEEAEQEARGALYRLIRQRVNDGPIGTQVSIARRYDLSREAIRQIAKGERVVGKPE